MSTKKIITDYKQALADKAAADQQAQADKQAALRVQARQIEALIREVIRPVFDQAERDIVEEGFFCRVETVAFRHNLLDQDSAFEVTLKLSTSPKNDELAPSYIAYEGDIDQLTVCKLTLVAHSRQGPQKARAMPIGSMTAEVVQSDLASFLRQVFRA